MAFSFKWMSNISECSHPSYCCAIKREVIFLLHLEHRPRSKETVKQWKIVTTTTTTTMSATVPLGWRWFCNGRKSSNEPFSFCVHQNRFSFISIKWKLRSLSLSTAGAQMLSLQPVAVAIISVGVLNIFTTSFIFHSLDILSFHSFFGSTFSYFSRSCARAFFFLFFPRFSVVLFLHWQNETTGNV